MKQGYNLESILQVYNVAAGLEAEISNKKRVINSLQEEISKLQIMKRGNEALLDASRKNWDTYCQLEVMKFGLEELKQLWHIITDISKSRGIDSHDAVSIFIKDVEENYYEKLFFESRVIEKKKELEMINNQLIVDRRIISAQPFVGTSMSQLYRNGITEQDIVDLVQMFQNCFKQNEQQEKTNTEAYSNESSNVTGWKVLAEELKKYKGIKEAVRNGTLDLNKLRDKYSAVVKDLKNLSSLYQTAYYLINILNNCLFYFKGYFDLEQNQNKYGSNIMPCTVIIPFIIVALHPDNDHKEKKNENSFIDGLDDNASEHKDNKNRESGIEDTS